MLPIPDTQSTHFNPRSPHGERRKTPVYPSDYHDFNPRSPHGERQDVARVYPRAAQISTHAPRTGSDGESVPASAQPRHFNPRSPHGERLLVEFEHKFLY